MDEESEPGNLSVSQLRQRLAGKLPFGPPPQPQNQSIDELDRTSTTPVNFNPVLAKKPPPLPPKQRDQVKQESLESVESWELDEEENSTFESKKPPPLPPKQECLESAIRESLQGIEEWIEMVEENSTFESKKLTPQNQLNGEPDRKLTPPVNFNYPTNRSPVLAKKPPPLPPKQRDQIKQESLESVESSELDEEENSTFGSEKPQPLPTNPKPSRLRTTQLSQQLKDQLVFNAPNLTKDESNIISLDPPPSPRLRDRASYEAIRGNREQSIGAEEISSPFQGAVYHCLKECLDTEKSYIQDLEILMQYYNSISSKQKSLGKLGIGLTKSKVKTIFQEIPKLLTFHQECLPDFEKYFTTGDSTYRSNVIKKKSRVMRMYGDFIINMTSATDIITEYEDYFCELKEQEGIEKFLNSVHLTPFQRITRYPLLIKALIKEASKANDNQIDIPALECFLKDVSDVVQYVNSVKEVGAIKELPKDITGRALGFLVKSGDVVCHQKLPHLWSRSIPPVDCKIFMFDKTILICEKTLDKVFTFKTSFKIKDVHAMSLARAHRIERSYCCLELQRTRGVEEINEVILECKDKEDKEQWLNEINECIKKINVDFTFANKL